MTRTSFHFPVFTCDICGTETTGSSTKQDEKLSQVPWKTLGSWHTDTMDERKPSKHRHYCPGCYPKTGLYDRDMADAYREARRLGIPRPQEVQDWLDAKAEEFQKQGNPFPYTAVAREYGLYPGIFDKIDSFSSWVAGLDPSELPAGGELWPKTSSESLDTPVGQGGPMPRFGMHDAHGQQRPGSVTAAGSGSEAAAGTSSQPGEFTFVILVY